MEQSVYQRIKTAMTVCRMNNSDLANQTGYQRQTVFNWFKSSKGLNDEAIEKILKAMPGLQKKYVLLGEGPMFKNEPIIGEADIVYNKQDPQNESNKMLIESLNKLIESKDELIAELKMKIKILEDRDK